MVDSIRYHLLGANTALDTIAACVDAVVGQGLFATGSAIPIAAEPFEDARAQGTVRRTAVGERGDERVVKARSSSPSANHVETHDGRRSTTSQSLTSAPSSPGCPNVSLAAVLGPSLDAATIPALTLQLQSLADDAAALRLSTQASLRFPSAIGAVGLVVSILLGVLTYLQVMQPFIGGTCTVHSSSIGVDVGERWSGRRQAG